MKKKTEENNNNHQNRKSNNMIRQCQHKTSDAATVMFEPVGENVVADDAVVNVSSLSGGFHT